MMEHLSPEYNKSQQISNLSPPSVSSQQNNFDLMMLCAVKRHYKTGRCWPQMLLWNKQ